MRRSVFVGMAGLLGLIGLSSVYAEDVTLVDGNIWASTSQAEKVAYIVGAGNMLEVEFAFQKQTDNPPADDQTTATRFWSKLDDVGVDDLIRAVDAFYADNPGERTKPVLVVVWNLYVEPE